MVNEAIRLGAGELCLARAVGVAVDVAVPVSGLARVLVAVVAVIASTVLGGAGQAVAVTVADGDLQVLADERGNGIAAGQDAQERRDQNHQEFPLHECLR